MLSQHYTEFGITSLGRKLAADMVASSVRVSPLELSLFLELARRSTDWHWRLFAVEASCHSLHNVAPNYTIHSNTFQRINSIQCNYSLNKAGNMN